MIDILVIFNKIPLILTVIRLFPDPLSQPLPSVSQTGLAACSLIAFVLEARTETTRLISFGHQPSDSLNLAHSLAFSNLLDSLNFVCSLASSLTGYRPCLIERFRMRSLNSDRKRVIAAAVTMMFSILVCLIQLWTLWSLSSNTLVHLVWYWISERK